MPNASHNQQHDKDIETTSLTNATLPQEFRAPTCLSKDDMATVEQFANPKFFYHSESEKAAVQERIEALEPKEVLAHLVTILGNALVKKDDLQTSKAARLVGESLKGQYDTELGRHVVELLSETMERPLRDTLSCERDKAHAILDIVFGDTGKLIIAAIATRPSDLRPGR